MPLLHPLSILHSTDTAYLFIDVNKVPLTLVESLAQAGVEILPYESLGELLTKASSGEMGKVWMDSRTANQAVYR